MKTSLPVKTLHGSDWQALQNDYIRAMNKLRDAMEAVAFIEIHSRDYATFNDFSKARDEWYQALNSLSAVHDYLEESAIHLNSGC
jgi:hypothetical protein